MGKAEGGKAARVGTMHAMFSPRWAGRAGEGRYNNTRRSRQEGHSGPPVGTSV